MTMARNASTAVARDSHLDDLVEPASQVRPPWLLAFLCLLIAILPSYQVIPGPLKSNGSPAKIVAIMLAGLALLGFMLIRRTAPAPALRIGAPLVLTYLLLTTLVYGVGVAQPGKDFAVAMIAEAANVGLAIYAMTRVTTARHRSLVLGFLCVGLAFNCVAGLLQATSPIDLHLLFQPPGFVDNQVDLGRGLAATPTERFGAKRAVGTSGHPIEFAVLAAITVPLAIHFARFATHKKVRWAAAMVSVVALLAMATGVSRSGLVTLATAFLVYMWTLKVRELAIALGVGITAGLLGFAFAPRNAEALWNTVINSADDGSVLERIDDYAKVSDTVREHPWFGIGLGRATPTDYGYLDNQWLQQLVQGGFVGFTALLVVGVGGIFGIAAALRSARTRLERNQAFTIGAMLAGILAASFTFDLFAFQQATLLLFILFGLLWSNFSLAVPNQ